MPGSRGVLVLALLSLVGQRPLHAECTIDRVTSTAADLVDHVRLLFHGGSSRHTARSPQVQAQAIPSGGPAVDLSDPTRPTAAEDRLRPAPSPGGGKLPLSLA